MKHATTNACFDNEEIPLNNLNKTFFICGMLVLLCVASSSRALAFSFNPPNEKTGAPNENNCSQCHTGNTLNAAGGSLMLTTPDVYTPGMQYDIVVELSRAGQSKWGFQMTALNSNDARAGAFAISNGNTQKLEEANSRQYIEHKSASGTNRWTFKWTAPTTDVGQITFYAAGNAANNANGALGDYIYTQKATSDSIAYGVALAGVGTLSKTANTGVETRYTLKVTNTGNTRDTIGLTTSGISSARLSQTSVALAANASTNVTLTIPGSALTSAGEYTATVTASSHGDSSKTAEITTTTTIPNVYSVTLAGVGSLTKETADSSTGVTYSIRVTNNGNTNDTVRLTTSGDATATISPSSISLNQGASRIVTLRIPGISLTGAGDYNVKATATSQGDSTKTAEITTTTTILPVYDIAIEGVGEVTTETADASDGISYTLKITNNGNTDDTIDLATEGTDATLSQTSVSLASSAAAEVTLTIAGDVLALAGDYEVKATATSQGDSTKTAEITTTTTVLPVYDITIEGVSELTTETADASDGISYTLQIANNGNTDDTIDLATEGTDATLSQTSVSLASGATAEVTLTIAGDVLALAGDYEVKATATSQGDSTQTAEITTTTTILPVYDIALEGVGELTTETADASDGISYTLQIANNGNTDDTIDLATEGTDATLSQTSVSLASGATAEVTLTIAGDVLALAGDYEVKATATSQGDSTKTAEITTTTTILPVYDIALEGVGEVTSETADASDGISYTLKITNNGNTDDTIDLATSGTAATLSQTSVSLVSGAAAEVTLTIAGDVLTLAGDYEVKATATSQGDSTQTVEITTTTTILPVYDIALEGVGELTTETADASDGISYTLKITNNGNTDDTIDLATEGTDATLSQTSVSLASGATAEVTLTIAGDVLALAGDYEVKATATSQGDSTQTVEITTTTTILSVYDIAIEGVGEVTTETADASDGVSYTLKITNNGNTDDTIDLATEGTDATLSQTSVSLASGATAEVTLTIAGDVLALAGDYEVKVTATSQGDSTQTVEITTTTTILPVYDIALEGVGELTTETTDASDGGSYTLKITNNGNTDDTIDLATEGTAATLSQTSVSLASSAAAEVTLTISGDVLTLAGDYEVKATATSQGDSTQTVEITTTTTILPVYDIAIEGVGELTTETADASDGVSYTLKITNNGNTDDTIDLATEGTDATLSQTSVSLASSAAAEVTLTISGDVLTLAGDYEVKVTATSQGDNTKTAEVTTTTTVLPVFGAMLASNTLTGATTDMVAGVTYILTVTNTGNTDDTLLLSSSAEIGIGGAVLGAFNLPNSEEPDMAQLEIMLAAGESAEVEFTASGDLLTQPGEYEIVVTVTSQGDTTKTAQITTTTTMTAVPPEYGVQLQAVAELKGSTMDILTGVTYALTVTNTGNTEDTIVLSSSAEFGIEGNVLGSFSQSDDQEISTSQLQITLEADETVEVKFTAAGDLLTQSGEYEIVVTATSQGDTTKTAEITTTTTILPVYDIAIEGVGELTTETADASDGVSYTLKITNNGNTDDTIDLATEGTDATLSQTSVSLASSTAAEVTLTISEDVLALAGDYEVKVTTTSQGDTTKTVEITTTTTILPVYDIVIEGVGEVTTETTDASDGISYTLKITNNGNTDDTIDLATEGIDATLSQTSVSLASSAAAEVTLTISGDVLALAGPYEVKATATSQSDSSKTAEITTTTTILPVYDIALEGVGEVTSETADVSDGVSYTLKIANNGNTDDTIDLATSGTAATLSQTSVSLASGAAAEVTLTISGDELALAGPYEVKAAATSQGDNTKTVEITTTTTILPVYDIAIEGVGEVTTETADASDGISYTLKITNNGNTDDTIDLATSGTAATLSQTSVSLASSVAAEVTLTISGDVLALAGPYEVKATATSQSDSSKTAEITTTTTILPVYDIAIEGVGELTSETADASDGVSYTLKITNNGNTDDTIDLATEGTDATLSQTSVSLASGAAAEVTLTISGDALALAGPYEVKATATSQGDNTKTTTVTTTTTVLPVYGVTLSSETLTGAMMDAVEGVIYALTVTNTGNTADTIVLSSSAEVGIEGVVLGSFNLPNSEEPNMAQLEIMLDAGASADVMFIAAGDFFTKPGEYEIVVTATSQGDTTKTAQLTTITSIPPEYGVQLQGVGELTGATWNFLKGITYQLTVTNTGNTEDTIMLGSSAEVGIGGAVLGSFSLPDSEEPATSQLPITLAADESADVIFTVSGDLLTQPGEYEIVVTATLQGDTTKTAEITTTTTIEHVPWDLNADGKINILDLVAVANQLGESGEGLSGDVNMDGEVNILDLVAVTNQLGKTSVEIVQAANQ